MNRIRSHVDKFLRGVATRALPPTSPWALGLGLALAATAATAPPAHAALLDRGGGMVYDTVQDITWLVDWNQAQTQGHDADGRMDWLQANAWANGLVHGGFDDWRLPVIQPGDANCSLVTDGGAFGPQHYGYGCSQGEMGHLFYVDLEVSAGWPITGGNPALLALFQNMQLGAYWMRNEFEPATVNAWYFNTIDGGQFTADKGSPLWAVAVRDGDVLSFAVPAPASLPLTLIAIAAAGALARARRGARRTARADA